MQSSKERLKQFEYFRSKLEPNGLLFLQETHSTIACRKKRNDEFEGDLLFLHGSYNFCEVFVAFYGNQDIAVKKKLSDKKGGVLVLDARIDDSDFLLINIYNANMEKEQVSVLNELITILSNLGNTLNHNVIFARDFNIFFDASLDAKGGIPTLKSRSVNKLIELNETLNLCDIPRKRNPKKRKYTFRQIHLSGIIQRGLDYIFISQNLQEYVKKSEALDADHSPVFRSISK